MIETQRLILRPWREGDLAPYAAMMADPDVANWLGGTMTLAEAEASLARRAATFEHLGFAMWVVERKADGVFLGSVGLDPAGDDIPFAPVVEVGWRLVRNAWGLGYATEAARAAIDDGFMRCGLAEIVAITARTNPRSQAVMERLGMARRPDLDFDHPNLAPDDPLRPHVVYVARADV
ncbi:MAG: GNAT family N-acetyltransferase [Caulobacteraceae bacterium]